MNLLELLVKQKNESALNEFISIIRKYEADIKELQDILEIKQKALEESLDFIDNG